MTIWGWAQSALKEAGSPARCLLQALTGYRKCLMQLRPGSRGGVPILNDGKYQFQLGLAMALAAKQGKLDVKSLPQKYRQFEIPAVNVNRENVNQVVHDYIESTPKYDLSDFFAQWSVAIP
jgi:hypothetical protein